MVPKNLWCIWQVWGRKKYKDEGFIRLLRPLADTAEKGIQGSFRMVITTADKGSQGSVRSPQSAVRSMQYAGSKLIC